MLNDYTHCPKMKSQVMNSDYWKLGWKQMMTYALGPDHVHVTVSYMHKKFKKNERKLRQLLIGQLDCSF